MKRMIIIALVALVALPLSAARAQELVRQYHEDEPAGFDIEVWVDNEDGIYYSGDEIVVYFEATRDCYAAVYSIDTRGQVNLLFPEDPGDDGFIRGGEMYSVPGRFGEYDLIVSGPEGIEHIQAVGTLEEMEIPRWHGGTNLRIGERDDPEDFIEDINRRYFNCRWDDCLRAYDRTSIYVKSPHYYYKPVYIPNYWYDAPDYSMIYIDYPYGGEVYIDGIFIGVAPLYIPRIIIGWHWFTIYDHFGYCWEENIQFTHDHYVHLDHSRVKTNRTVVSRYNDLRQQAKKYRKSDYVLSEKRVKSAAMTEGDRTVGKFSRPDSKGKFEKEYRTKSTAGETAGRVTPDTADRKEKKKENRWDSWNSQRSEPSNQPATRSGEMNERKKTDRSSSSDNRPNRISDDRSTDKRRDDPGRAGQSRPKTESQSSKSGQSKKREKSTPSKSTPESKSSSGGNKGSSGVEKSTPSKGHSGESAKSKGSDGSSSSSKGRKKP